MKIAHIINPVKVPASSDLFVAQPVTFRAMIHASRCVTDPDLEVELHVISYPEDDMRLPDDFHVHPPLQRSVLDMGSFSRQRKLPLIRDILDPLISSTDADYIIYSNVDISPMPYFYDYVAEQLKEHDALVINRRTISKSDDPAGPLAGFCSQVGSSHPGFDCFVFRKDRYNNFILGSACVGANWIGRVLICNLMAFSDKFFLEKEAHLTFHLGDDRSWKTARNADFDEHNERELAKLMVALREQQLLGKHPLLQQTYEEFVSKEKDPDPGRPKRSDAGGSDDVNHIDTSKLFHQYRPSNSWEGRDDNIISQHPVFIVGYPRSGTTLLQSLVATQYAPAVFPETHFFSITRTKLIVKDDRIQPECLGDVLEFIHEKLVIAPELERYITDATRGQYLSPKMLFESIVYDQLARNVPADRIATIPWMEKTPDHICELDVIHRYYPKVRVIFVVRNPEYAILSRRKHFTWNDEVSWPIEKHVKKWIDAIDAADRFQGKHKQNILFVRFEDLVDDKDREMSRICAFLGTDYQSADLANYTRYSKQQALPWETWKEDTSKGISGKIALKAKGTLSAGDRERMTALAGSYLERFSYTCGQKSGLRQLAKKMFGC